MTNLTDFIEERGEYWWPANDQGCWKYMNDTLIIPQLLASHVPEKGVIVQAGGNAGIYVKKYAEMFGMVYTFEPDPVAFICLVVNCDFPNVVKFQACVGNKPGLVQLGVWEGDIGATHIVPGDGVIPTMLIDNLGLTRCDMIQLDIEGFEYNALLGAEKTIDAFKPVIAVEWCEEWGARYNVTLDMIEDFLKKWNYELVATHLSDRVYVVK